MPAGNPTTKLESTLVSGTFTATTNGADFSERNASGGFFFLNITAASGTTPTLDVKIQAKCEKTGIDHDIPGAAFTQKTAATTEMLVVSPRGTVSANRPHSHPLPATFRAVATIAGTTPSFTFSLTYCPAQ